MHPGVGLALATKNADRVSQSDTSGTDKGPITKLAVTGLDGVLVAEPESDVPNLVAQRTPVTVRPASQTRLFKLVGLVGLVVLEDGGNSFLS